MPESKGNFNYYASLSGDKQYMKDNGYNVVAKPEGTKTKKVKETSAEGDEGVKRTSKEATKSGA